MRILHIPPVYHPAIGGTETTCKRLSETLARRGHDVRVLTTNFFEIDGFTKLGIRTMPKVTETIGNVSVTRLDFANGGYQSASQMLARLWPRQLWGPALSLAFSPMLLRRFPHLIAQHIKELRPDVVMAMPHLVENVAAVIAAKKYADFPLVMVPMLHEHDPGWSIPRMARALRSADAVIALTQHEANRLVESYRVHPDCVFVAKAGVDRSQPGPPVHERHPRRVLFLGRRARSKNIGELIQAMQQVWLTHPDVELCIVGARTSSPDHVDVQIAALPAHLRRQVMNLGAVSEDEKSALLQSARCLVLPSKVESFGIVLLEAWAHATPVITWDLPVFRSFIRNRVSGLLADPDGGAHALANAILEMLENADQADAMAQTGFQLANSVYSWESVADIYLAAYEYAARQSQRNKMASRPNPAQE